MQESIPLTREQSEQLLRPGLVGRMAVVTPRGPRRVPVNYVVVDDAVVVRTAEDSSLGRWSEGALAALETDHLDYDDHHGWSVVVHGRGAWVTDPVAIDRFEARWPPTPWASGKRSRYVRLAWSEIHGQRLGRGWDPGSLPVRRVM